MLLTALEASIVTTPYSKASLSRMAASITDLIPPYS
jgi:hypothetical protein